LEYYWTDSRKRGGFWKYEWSKHGTCALSVPITGTQRKYFEVAIATVKKLNMEGILAKSGIVPHATRQYSSKELTIAIQRALGTNIVPHYVREVHLLN